MKTLVLIVCLLFSMAATAAKPKAGLTNIIGCSLFNENGELLKKYQGWICGFFPNGNMILGDGYTLTFYDKNMDVVWQRDVHSHHFVVYSAADDTALVITSKITDETVRSDRLEVYGSSGKLLKAFDLTKEQSTEVHSFGWFDQHVMPKVRQEITHVRSFYRIGKNKSKHPALAEGNYIVCETYGKIFILDKNLKKVIHTFNYSDWQLSGLNDVQVTKRGNLLFYVNENPRKFENYSSLVELDPLTGKVVWSYHENPPEAFHGIYEGTVQELENGNMLYSVIVADKMPDNDKEMLTAMHHSVEITRGGKKVWTMVADNDNLSGVPGVLRRMDLSSYRKNKGRF